MSLCLAARWAAMAVAVATASVVGAQDAAGPPPAPAAGGGLYVHELLPDLGLIGAEVGLVAGACVNPYDAGHGICGGGFIALPLRRAAGGKFSYEIALSVGTGRSDPFTITDPFAYVANLAAGASPTAAATGPPQAPFPVHRLVRTRLRMLQVSPFGLRYMPTGRRARLHPYLAAGIDAIVVMTTQLPVTPDAPNAAGAPVFNDPLIGGLAAQAPELAARGLPSGQGNLQLGAHGAAGLELRTGERVSVNLEYRFTAIESAGGGTHAVTGALGLHW
jgi:hypothetical protein